MHIEQIRKKVVLDPLVETAAGFLFGCVFCHVTKLDF